MKTFRELVPLRGGLTHPFVCPVATAVELPCTSLQTAVMQRPGLQRIGVCRKESSPFGTLPPTLGITAGKSGAETVNLDYAKPREIILPLVGSSQLLFPK